MSVGSRVGEIVPMVVVSRTVLMTVDVSPVAPAKAAVANAGNPVAVASVPTEAASRAAPAKVAAANAGSPAIVFRTTAPVVAATVFPIIIPALIRIIGPATRIGLLAQTTVPTAGRIFTITT